MELIEAGISCPLKFNRGSIRTRKLQGWKLHKRRSVVPGSPNFFHFQKVFEGSRGFLGLLLRRQLAVAPRGGRSTSPAEVSLTLRTVTRVSNLTKPRSFARRFSMANSIQSSSNATLATASETTSGAAMSFVRQKSVVLLSAGMDSTVNFFEAIKSSEVVLALTFDYGQRAAPREIQKAARICELNKIPHQVIELPFFKTWGGSSLTDHSQTVPVGGSVSIDSHATSLTTAKSVWVPNRNGVFLNLAAGYAESLEAKWVIPGFNKEEASTFPDNSQAFLEQATKALSFSTANQVEVKCFTTDLNKSEIVKRGLSLGVDFSLMWPCYLAGESWCGQCESCQRSKRALEAADLSWEQLASGELK